MAAALFATLWPLLLTTWEIPGYLLFIFAGFALLAFRYQHFALCGVALACVAIGLNADLPYRQVFDNCRYKAHFLEPSYATSRRASPVILMGRHIVCDGTELPDQKIQYWDNRRQLRPYQHQAVVVSSRLQPVHSRLNPNSFDYERYLITNGIRLTAKRLHFIQAKAESHAIYRLRHYLSRQIIKHLSAPQAAIVLALVTGNRSALTSRQKQAMQATGTSHLLAISGLHLGLLGGLAWLLFQGLWALSRRASERLMPIQAGAIFALIVITLYAWLTGFDVPIQRAWIMFVLLIISWLWLKSLSTNSLLLAAIIVMLVDPYAVTSVGFYFSFIATYIVLWTLNLTYRPLIKIVLMQICITAILLPITWFAFGTLPLAAFAVNLLVIPWLGLWVLPWAVLAVVIDVPLLWQWLDFSTAALWHVIEWFQQLDWVLSPNFRPTLIAVIITTVALLAALVLRKKWPLLGVFFLLLPIQIPTRPSLIVADSRYTSVLVHNGHQAILINPGRYYRRINHAKKWRQYLQRRRLSLAAIVLENDKVSRISSTYWLAEQYPDAEIISLKRLDLPYQTHYCQSYRTDHMQLIMREEKGRCRALLNWYGESFDMLVDRRGDDQGNNAITGKSSLIWRQQHYDASILGAVTLMYRDKQVDVDAMRWQARRWRAKIK